MTICSNCEKRKTGYKCSICGKEICGDCLTCNPDGEDCCFGCESNDWDYLDEPL